MIPSKCLEGMLYQRKETKTAARGLKKRKKQLVRSTPLVCRESSSRSPAEMSHLVTRVTTHSRKVCSLYKRSLRNLEAWYDRRYMYRYRAVLLRARFDENKDIKDMRVAQQLLDEGEKELFSVIHYQPRQFAYSPGGVAHGREVVPPDWVLDYWHPMEKAAYPEYFARREQRKKEYVEWWEKTYGKPAEPAH